MPTQTLKTHIVIRNDIAENWKTANPVLLKGELGLETDTNKFKIGDGATNWNALPYSPEIDATAVTLTKDITATYSFGKYQPDASGSVVIPAEGKTLEEFLQGALAQEKNPTITQPTAVLNSSNIGSKEVGTNIQIDYSFATNKGKYSYGPDTAVTFSDYQVTFNGETLTGSTGRFASVQVTDTTNLSITGSCQSSDGAIPKTNLGNDYAAGKIVGKTFNVSKGTLTGFRGWFYGYYNGTNAIADASAITSESLRAFGVKTSFPTTLTTNKMKQMFFAAPKGRKASLTISNAVNGAPLTVQKASVMVEGANKYKAVEYDLFYVSNAVAESGESKWNIK